jgi:hypothetical protein
MLAGRVIPVISEVVTSVPFPGQFSRWPPPNVSNQAFMVAPFLVAESWNWVLSVKHRLVRL